MAPTDPAEAAPHPDRIKKCERCGGDAGEEQRNSDDPIGSAFGLVALFASIRHRVSALSTVPGAGTLRTRGPFLIGRDMSAPVRAVAVQVLRGEAAALLGLPGRLFRG